MRLTRLDRDGWRSRRGLGCLLSKRRRQTVEQKGYSVWQYIAHVLSVSR
jgi:hypothetical protein